MYAINEETKRINGEVVETFEREVVDGNTVLLAEAGTTGYKGAARSNGGRTYICLDCVCGDFHFDQVTDNEGNVVGTAIACCGDDGLNALMKALDFVRQVLNDQRCDVDD